MAALSLTIASCGFCSSDQRFAIRLPSDSTSRWTPLSLAVSFPLPGRIRTSPISGVRRKAHHKKSRACPLRFFTFLTFQKTPSRPLPQRLPCTAGNTFLLFDQLIVVFRSMILPCSSTIMQSLLRTVESRCAITKVVLPLISLSIPSCTSFSVLVSMELVASSRIRTGGSATASPGLSLEADAAPDLNSLHFRSAACRIPEAGVV